MSLANQLFAWTRGGKDDTAQRAQNKDSRSKTQQIPLPLHFHAKISVESDDYITIDGLRLAASTEINLDAPLKSISAAQIHRAARAYSADSLPPFGMLVFDVTGDIRALDGFFPINLTLNTQARQIFHTLIQNIATHPNFDIRCFDQRTTIGTLNVPPAIRHLVAGEIAALFFYRRDILKPFFAEPRHFWFYMDDPSFKQFGGMAGGCYDPESQSIKLLTHRLFEGLFTTAPGVAPFLHEFGHMLDAFNSATGTMGKLDGDLPGLRPINHLADSETYALFVRGKQLEYSRYSRFANREAHKDSVLPLGHPYVFQNDTEFIAGYLELFFRIPHRFYDLNPMLYKAFGLLLKQDPRRYRETDFAFYIEENERAYTARVTRLKPAGLRNDLSL